MSVVNAILRFLIMTRIAGMEKLLTMSHYEREKLKVMHQLQKGELSRSAAAGCLGLSTRQIYRLYARYLLDGDEGIIHGLRG